MRLRASEKLSVLLARLRQDPPHAPPAGASPCTRFTSGRANGCRKATKQSGSRARGTGGVEGAEPLHARAKQTKDFLDEFPQGANAAAAKEKLVAIEKAEAAAKATREKAERDAKAVADLKARETADWRWGGDRFGARVRRLSLCGSDSAGAAG